MIYTPTNPRLTKQGLKILSRKRSVGRRSLHCPLIGRSNLRNPLQLVRLDRYVDIYVRISKPCIVLYRRRIRYLVVGSILCGWIESWAHVQYISRCSPGEWLRQRYSALLTMFKRISHATPSASAIETGRGTNVLEMDIYGGRHTYGASREMPPQKYMFQPPGTKVSLLVFTEYRYLLYSIGVH